MRRKKMCSHLIQKIIIARRKYILIAARYYLRRILNIHRSDYVSNEDVLKRDDDEDLSKTIRKSRRQ